MKTILTSLLLGVFWLTVTTEGTTAQQRLPQIWILDITPDDFGPFFNPFVKVLTGSNIGYDVSIVHKWQEINSAPNDIVVVLIATNKTVGNAASAEEIKRLMGLEAMENYNNQTLHGGGLNSSVPETHVYRDALKEARSRRGIQGILYNMVVSMYDQCNNPSYMITNFDFINTEYERHGAENGRRVVDFLKASKGK